MLDDSTKAQIQQAYTAWLDARGFQGRRGQRQMIAHIARTLSNDVREDRQLIIEAGTGIGKTVAYILAALPVARARGKRLVVATATIALQEQLAFRDLPDMAERSGLQFNFQLAKGRGRYLCPQRLGVLLANAQSASADLFGAEASEQGLSVWRSLNEAFVTQRWDGDRDNWDHELSDGLWSPVTNDHRGCMGRRCPEFSRCPYFQARVRSETAEIIVANHDLVLADLALGGGVVLPPPEEAVFIFDEAHHLQEKAQSHFAVDLRLNSSIQWLERLNPTLVTMAQRLGRPLELQTPLHQVVEAATASAQLLAGMEAHLLVLPMRPSEGRFVHRFPLGAVSLGLVACAAELLPSLAKMDDAFTAIDTAMNQALAGDVQWPHADELESLYPLIGGLRRRLEYLLAAISDLAHATKDSNQSTEGREEATIGSGHITQARWWTRDETEWTYQSAPVSVHEQLAAQLWTRCDGALLTSATLAPLGYFDQLRERLGLPAAIEGIRLASPFHYAEQGVLVIPRLNGDPSDPTRHTDEIKRVLPDLLTIAPGTLVLFTSWKQLRQVFDALPPRLTRRVLRQGDLSRSEILNRHREAIDAGRESAIFGVSTFAEGIDLPGAYCSHVIIAKLPFPVPDEPLFEALSEWLSAQGRDSFAEVSVPTAALKLVQACGRLIRNETDTGRITVLDRRLITKGYGRDILESLPPFRREFA